MDNCFFWSDNWWIEGEYAWMVDGEHAILFRVNLKTRQCEYIKRLPDDSIHRFRLNSRCIKCGEVVFCMPDTGQYIWAYWIREEKFEKIEIDNPKGERIAILGFWQYGEKIFAYARGLKQIIEINLEKRNIENYYCITKELNIQLAGSVNVKNKIYAVSVETPRIYEFDMETKNVVAYDIPNINGKLHTICFDGEKFWLSGYRKELYIWNKEENTVKIIKKFPENFGIYNFEINRKQFIDYTTDEYDTPAFLSSVALQNTVWFMPFQTNQIIYVNKNTYEINEFKVHHAIDVQKQIANISYLRSEYMLQCIKKERFMVLYSFGENCIYEIDTKKKKCQKKNYVLNKKTVQHMVSEYKGKYIFLEKRQSDVRLFREILFGEENIYEENILGVGKNINDVILNIIL